MKRTIQTTFVLLIAFVTAMNLTPAQTQHEVSVVNIQVPVRVYLDDAFIDNLKIENFEITEDGVPQVIEALYLAQKDRVVREEEFREYTPETGRHFFLLFQTIDYNPRLAGAFDHFFTQVMMPSDNLTVMTPMHNYTLSSQALQSKPGEKLAKELSGIVRKDTQTGASNYRDLLRDLKRIVRSLSNAAGGSLNTGLENEGSSSDFGLDFMLPRYRETLEKMESLRVVDQKKFLGFASSLKVLPGQKYVFFFYQREFRPQIQARIINNLITLNQDKPNVQGDLMDLMNFYHRENRANVELMRNAFADSGVFFNFIFMNKEPENISGVHMQEQSEDVFETMSAVANATGGIIDTSQNPAEAFKNGCRKSENYYLLYYTPKDYRDDGGFRKIEVKLKNQDSHCKVFFRAGYFAR